MWNKRGKYKRFMFALTACLLLAGLYGCESELSETDIKNTDTYQELETEYSKLQRKYDKLAGTQADATTEETQTDAGAYLKKLRRGTFVKVRYVCRWNSSYEITDNASVCKWLKNQLGKALEDTNQNADELLSEQTALYDYTLYNEDNSICRCQVYEGDYVIFTDIPDTVYYASGVSRLGAASFPRENAPELSRSFKLMLYESQMAYSDGELLSAADTRTVAAAFADLNLKKLSAKPYDVEATAQREYIFKCDGTTFVVEVYQSYISVTRENDPAVWYTVSENEIKNFLKLPD